MELLKALQIAIFFLLGLLKELMLKLLKVLLMECCKVGGRNARMPAGVVGAHPQSAICGVERSHTKQKSNDGCSHDGCSHDGCSHDGWSHDGNKRAGLGARTQVDAVPTPAFVPPPLCAPA
eukprot:214490-Chlamydomonas_euryale.AAC.1